MLRACNRERVRIHGSRGGSGRASRHGSRRTRSQGRENGGRQREGEGGGTYYSNSFFLLVEQPIELDLTCPHGRSRAAVWPHSPFAHFHINTAWLFESKAITC